MNKSLFKNSKILKELLRRPNFLSLFDMVPVLTTLYDSIYSVTNCFIALLGDIGNHDLMAKCKSNIYCQSYM